MTEHADVERAQDTKRAVERASAEARPSAKDLIEKLMVIYGSLAATFQPGSLKSPNPNADDALFRFWSDRALNAAKALMPFEVAKPVAAAPSPVQIEFDASVTAKVQVADDIDLSRLTVEALTRLYRARVAGTVWVPSDSDYMPAGALPAPDATPRVHVPEAASMPVVTGAPVDVEPVELEELEPVVSEPEPEAAPPAAPPNLVRFPESAKAVQEYADSIASAVGPDGRPRAVNARAILQAALSRAAVPRTRIAGMPRRSGVSR